MDDKPVNEQESSSEPLNTPSYHLYDCLDRSAESLSQWTIFLWMGAIVIAVLAGLALAS